MFSIFHCLFSFTFEPFPEFMVKVLVAIRFGLEDDMGVEGLFGCGEGDEAGGQDQE